MKRLIREYLSIPCNQLKGFYVKIVGDTCLVDYLFTECKYLLRNLEKRDSSFHCNLPSPTSLIARQS